MSSHGLETTPAIGTWAKAPPPIMIYSPCNLHGIFNIIHNVTMDLIPSNRADSASLTMATFDVVHAPMTPVVPNTLPVLAASELPRHVHQPIMADNFIDKYVTDSNLYTSFLREDLSSMSNFEKIQKVFDPKPHPTPMMASIC